MTANKAEIFCAPLHNADGGHYGGDRILCITLDCARIALNLGANYRKAALLEEIINAGIQALSVERRHLESDQEIPV